MIVFSEYKFVLLYIKRSAWCLTLRLLDDLLKIILTPIIGITDKRTPLRFFCVLLLLSTMSYSHIPGYDLSNDRPRSVIRTEAAPIL